MRGPPRAVVSVAGDASRSADREPLLSESMQTESSTINYAAAAISTVGAVAGLASAVLPRGPRDTASRIALISGLLGLVGTIAWLLAARSDHHASRARAAA